MCYKLPLKHLKYESLMCQNANQKSVCIKIQATISLKNTKKIIHQNWTVLLLSSRWNESTKTNISYRNNKTIHTICILWSPPLNCHWSLIQLLRNSINPTSLKRISNAQTRMKKGTQLCQLRAWSQTPLERSTRGRAWKRSGRSSSWDQRWDS